MFAAVVSIVMGAAGCEKQVRDTDIKLVSVSEVKRLWDRVERGDRNAMILIDPRPLKEYQAEHIRGARSLTLPQVNPKSERDPGIEGFSNIVVSGNDPGSATARGMTKRLISVGYEHIRFFAGGLEDWKRRKYPVDGKTPEAPVPETKPSDERVVEPEETPTMKIDAPPPEPQKP